MKAKRKDILTCINKAKNKQTNKQKQTKMQTIKMKTL